MKRPVVDFSDEILIPDGDVGDFAVIACDQFSSRPEYWLELEKTMPSRSALELILPECFLSDADARLEAVRTAARAMSDRFSAVKGAVLVTRKTAYGRTRKGLVASVELDCYDYADGNTAAIRASERTIAERIPPRVAIREAIDIELPHIMLLVDDPDGLMMKAAKSGIVRTLYDAELGGGGGRVKGELVDAADALGAAVDALIARSRQIYGTPLFALVGDGNHSLATAKYCAEHEPTAYNGRALVEIVNIYDEGIVFEPIHRLVRTDDPAMFVDSFRSAVKGDATARLFLPEPVEVKVPADKVEAIKAVDGFCETFVKHFGGDIEYVHGADALKKDGHVGIEMRGIEKSEFFGVVVKHGVLPKKTFSMGEAEEKRYYIEARRIK